jgi:hypothetical protein
MSNILDRITQIADLEGVTIGKIEQKIGASKGVLYKAIQKNTDIQSKWIVLIVENYPQYNSDWLLTGKGEILRDSIENNKVVATGLNKNATGVIDVKMFAELCEKVDFIYTTTLKELAQNQLAGLKSDIENIKNEKSVKK